MLKWDYFNQAADCKGSYYRTLISTSPPPPPPPPLNILAIVHYF